MKKGFKKKKVWFTHTLQKRHSLLLFVHHKALNLFHRPSTEEKQALRFISVFTMGITLFLIGGFNLHNNFVILALLGITSIILSVFLLSRDMEDSEAMNTSEEFTHQNKKEFSIAQTHRIEKSPLLIDLKP